MKKVFLLLFFITLALSAQGKALYTVDFSKQKDGMHFHGLHPMDLNFFWI